MATAASDQQEQRTPVRVAFPHDRRETAIGGNVPENTGDLDVRREALAQAASRSSAPMSTAASASRLRAPRIFSRVTAWRVTRLIAASALR
jgi:hypothetical protein